ncbi:hypothetical protein LWI29_034248 [Acer saccharum]|uniref:Uncharacterized protein n=1 Tax=Acer saccharum TaxID=4024 RepID=A0AA39VH47_ACESA|nr:hypothetical protein LWI29_034248 [Acer saccharum]
METENNNYVRWADDEDEDGDGDGDGQYGVEIEHTNPMYQIMNLNLRNDASATSVREKYGSLNLLINASGILSIPNVLQPGRDNFIDCNQHIWPLLKVGGGTGTERDVAVVANLSARVGSIGDNRLGGWYSYRSSKAALNQLTKNVSVEFARKKDPIICILLHPGTVDTDLSRPFQRNVPEGKLFTKEFSVQKLLGIINKAKRHDVQW